MNCKEKHLNYHLNNLRNIPDNSPEWTNVLNQKLGWICNPTYHQNKPKKEMNCYKKSNFEKLACEKLTTRGSILETQSWLCSNFPIAVQPSTASSRTESWSKKNNLYMPWETIHSTREKYKNSKKEMWISFKSRNNCLLTGHWHKLWMQLHKLHNLCPEELPEISPKTLQVHVSSSSTRHTNAKHTSENLQWNYII